MKILLTGGGTGGHFYPLIAVARDLKKIAEEERVFDLHLVYMSDDPYDKNLLLKEGIEFKKITSGKLRRYFSLLNFIDMFKVLLGTFKAFWNMLFDMPDVVFSKGGYASFPAVFVAFLLRIPTVIHESDAVPGLVNKNIGKFAKRIAISFPEASKFFPKNKTAYVGNPIRRELVGGTLEEAQNIFNFEENVPVIFVLGGSQGAQKINSILLDALLDLLPEYQVIHQCGEKNFKAVSDRSSVILEKSEFKKRYHLFPFLDESQMRNASFIASLVISRAGAASIFEIAVWKKPSILIPLPLAAQDHQRQNAYAYRRTDACEVMEEKNLTSHIFISEIKRIMNNVDLQEKMKRAASGFARPDAAHTIARGVIDLALEHAS